jgi:hypothetical protein
MHLDFAFVSMWGWPQWAVLFLLFLSLAVHVIRHGTPRIYHSGIRKGEPRRYNVIAAMVRTLVWVTLLKAGGFF